MPMLAPATAGKAAVWSKHSSVIPLKLPLDSARHTPRTARGYSYLKRMPDETMVVNKSLLQLNLVGARWSRATPGRGDPLLRQSCSLKTYSFKSSNRLLLKLLILLFANLFASTLTRQCGFYALFLAGLQIEGVALNLLDNVFLLHLAFETPQRVLEGFTLLQSNFRQTDTPPDPSCRTE
jgi:hypothetical protein